MSNVLPCLLLSAQLCLLDVFHHGVMADLVTRLPGFISLQSQLRTVTAMLLVTWGWDVTNITPDEDFYSQSDIDSTLFIGFAIKSFLLENCENVSAS